jgi:hypothetical protein
VERESKAEEIDRTTQKVVEPMKVFVAGEEIEAPLDVVARYVINHCKTAREYDLQAGLFPDISTDLIKATRVFSSRISNEQGNWFVDQGLSAPWGSIAVEDELVSADPSERDGLYDKGLELWNHFAIPAQNGVAQAKISKVLHAMRPSFFPVLDSRLRVHYKQQAMVMAKQMNIERSIKYAYWVAIRRDLVDSQKALEVVRSQLQSHENELVREWAAHVSNLRLHDVLAWSK